MITRSVNKANAKKCVSNKRFRTLDNHLNSNEQLVFKLVVYFSKTSLISQSRNLNLASTSDRAERVSKRASRKNKSSILSIEIEMV